MFFSWEYRMPIYKAADQAADRNTITPDPNGKPKLFTKKISKLPASDGKPGTMMSLMNKTQSSAYAEMQQQCPTARVCTF